MDDLIVITTQELQEALTQWGQRVQQRLMVDFGPSDVEVILGLLEELRASRTPGVLESAHKMEDLADQLVRNPWKSLQYYSDCIGEDQGVTLQMLRLLGAEKATVRQRDNAQRGQIVRVWAHRGESLGRPD